MFADEGGRAIALRPVLELFVQGFAPSKPVKLDLHHALVLVKAHKKRPPPKVFHPVLTMSSDEAIVPKNSEAIILPGVGERRHARRIAEIISQPRDDFRPCRPARHCKPNLSRADFTALFDFLFGQGRHWNDCPHADSKWNATGQHTSGEQRHQYGTDDCGGGFHFTATVCAPVGKVLIDKISAT